MLKREVCEYKNEEFIILFALRTKTKIDLNIEMNFHRIITIIPSCKNEERARVTKPRRSDDPVSILSSKPSIMTSTELIKLWLI